MKRLLPGLVFAAFWLVLAAGGRSNFFRDPGTYWHTVVGEKVLTEGFFDRDPFTFSFEGQIWIPHQWLGEVAMALAHRVNGFDAQFAAVTGMLAALFTALTLRFVRTGVNPVAAVLAVGLVLAASATHFHVRPHLATILGVAVTMMVVVDVESGRRRWTFVAALIPVYLVWANTHGGVLGGLTTLGLAGFGWALAALLGRPTPTPTARSVAGLSLIGLVCGAVCFANPYGVRIPETWLAIMHAPKLPEIIVEHAPTDFAEPATWPLALLMAGYVALLAGVPPTRWRVSWLFPLFWLVQAYGRVRHAPLFAVAAAVAAADLWPRTRWARLVATRRPDFYDPAAAPKPLTGRDRLVAWALPLVLVAGVAALQVSHSPWGRWAKFDETYWPADSLPAMRQHEPKPGEPDHLFNDYIDGAYSIYHTPGYKVFVDDRCELFGDDWLAEFVHAGGAGPPEVATKVAEWQANHGRFDFALTRKGTAFDAYFAARPGEWSAEFVGDVSRFYTRARPECSPTP
jgi:hypothetical protein